MRYTSLLLRSALLATLTTACVQADILLDLPSEIFTGTEPTLTTRLSRDGIPSDWSTTKAWPGVFGDGPFSYLTYTIPVLSTFRSTYIQVSIDDPFTGVFVSAYANQFVAAAGVPASANYLGDAGSSGNFFGNPGFFQVILPANASLVLLVNSTIQGDVTGLPFGLLVEGFSSTDYAPLPEPVTYGLSAAAVGLLMVLRRRNPRTVEAGN